VAGKSKNNFEFRKWQENLKITLSSGKIFGSEGLAINMSVYVDEVNTEFLPLNCNWIASNLLPIYDEQNNMMNKIKHLLNHICQIIKLELCIWPLVYGKIIKI